MKGWGRFSVLCMMGLGFGVGCGSRTGALEGDFDGVGAEGSGAQATGGSSSVAGKPNRGGSSSVGGATPVAGAAVGGSYPGGSGGYPAGAAGYPAGAGGSYGGGSAGYYPGGAGGYYPGGAGGYYPGGAGGYYPGGAGGSPPTCETCLAQSCGFQLLQCAQDVGCADIFICVQATGCTGLDCYSPNTCRNSIDMAGGLGSDSMSRLLSALTCVVQSGCGCR